jgi:large subunit ribosomal protein L29
MKAKDLRERSLEDLVELEKSLARDTFQSRLKNFTNQLDDTSSLKKTRRDLARVKTILGQLRPAAPVAAPAPTPAKAAAPKAKKAEVKAAAPSAPASRPAAAKSKPAPKSKPAAKAKKSEAK